jgi:hypothetical protein
MQTEIIVAIIAVTGTLLGVLIAHWGELRRKKIINLEHKVSILKSEIHARQCQENIASNWISCITEENEHTVKIKLRDLTEEKCGVRPIMAPSDLN